MLIAFGLNTFKDWCSLFKTSRSSESSPETKWESVRCKCVEKNKSLSAISSSHQLSHVMCWWQTENSSVVWSKNFGAKSLLICWAGKVFIFSLKQIGTKHFFRAQKHQLISPFVSITCKDKPVCCLQNRKLLRAFESHKAQEYGCKKHSPDHSI